MTGDLLIEIKGLSFAYPGREPVLSGLDFELAPGARIGLMGENGTGKTTLLHLVMGLLTPESGVIRLFGEKAETEKDFARARQKIGFLFQNADDQLFSPTVLEDVAFGPLNQGLPASEAKRIAVETLRDLGLDGFENRVTHRLSGGEKKLAALATVMAMRPRLLLLDEPTTGLDEKTKIKIADILKRLDVSFVIVSHEWDFIAETTTEIYGMTDGKILYNGQTAQVAHTHVHAHPLGGVPHDHD